jgi:hypothetical protein
MVSLFQPDVERDLGQPIGLTVTVSGGDGQYTFTWQSDDGSFWITTTPTSTFTPLYDGSYAIIVLVKDGSGASGISNKVFVKVNPQLKIALNPYFILTNGIVQNTQNMDMGQLARFTAIIWGGTAPYSVAWYVNGKHEGSSFIGGPGICEWDFTAPATGKYYVYAKVYDRYQQSVDSQVASLQVYAALTVNVTPDNKTMPSTMVSDVTLTAHVQGGLGPYSYIWHSDKFGTITIGPTMSTTADYTYNTPHTQLWKDIVTLDVYDSNGTSVKAQPIPIIVFPVTLPP